MSGTDEKFLKRLLATFRAEAREHIQAIASGLVELENASTQETKTSSLDAIFRAAHSLKGAARTVNNREIEAICQSLEEDFARLKRDLVPSPHLFDLLHQAATGLGRLLESTETGASAAPRMAEVIASLKSALADCDSIPETKPQLESAANFESAPDLRQDNLMETPALTDTIRVSAAKLDALLLQAEELLAAKLAAHRRVTGLRHPSFPACEGEKK